MKNYKVKIKNNPNLIIFTFLSVFLLFYFLFFISSETNAQENKRTVTIIPPTAFYTANPGKTIQGTVKIRNDSTKNLTFTASVYDFIVEDSIGTPKLLWADTLNNRFSLASWVRVIPQTFSLKSHDTQEIAYTIEVPVNARPGGHYATIIFSPTNSIVIKDSGALVESNIGSLLLVTVNGQLHEEASITKFFTQRQFYEYGPIDIFAQVKNSGDVHQKIAGKFKALDIFGKTIDRKELAEYNIFPDASRDYQAQLDNKFLLGPIKIDLNVSYGTNNQHLQARTLYVWVIPWQIITLVVLIVTTLILAIMLWRRKQTPLQGIDDKG